MNTKLHKNVRMYDGEHNTNTRDIQLNNLNWLNKFVVLKTSDENGVEYLAYEKETFDGYDRNIESMFECTGAYAFGETYKDMREDIKETYGW